MALLEVTMQDFNCVVLGHTVVGAIGSFCGVVSTTATQIPLLLLLLQKHGDGVCECSERILVDAMEIKCRYLRVLGQSIVTCS